jgi:predicted lysophospholipase L1 biosynthesis ABC-type transport system permease subunit
VEEKEIQDELASIRNIMERSSKFISLSGLSGVLAGIYALLGGAAAYYILYVMNPLGGIHRRYYAIDKEIGISVGVTDETYLLLFIAVLVLAASVITGIVLSFKKAKRNGQRIWSKTSQALLFNMATPLVAGGVLILILLFRGYYAVVSPASLIFYGLALVGASNFTFTDVKYLGLCEVLLGLIAACLPGYGLLFWAIGFGVLHIVYGSMMYFKYDK